MRIENRQKIQDLKNFAKITNACKNFDAYLQNTYRVVKSAYTKDGHKNLKTRIDFFIHLAHIKRVYKSLKKVLSHKKHSSTSH